VAALSSPNERAQLAATSQLQAIVLRWQAEPNIDHSADVQQLVHHLAEADSQLSPDQRLRLSPVVERLTAWPMQLEKPALAQYLANSEQLARSTADITPLSEKPATPTATKPQPAEPSAEVARTPETSPLPPLPVYNKPGFVLPSEDASPIPTDVAPRPTSTPPLMLEKLPPAPSNIRDSTDLPTRISQPPPDATRSSYLPQEEERRWKDWSDWQVIRLLPHSSDRQDVEAELRLRGYQNRDLAIARRAVDPEPTVRLQLVEELPRMSGIDARLWLQQLAEDSDHAVRTAAASILRTAYNGPVAGKGALRR
jgi:hypothetical protein